MDKRLLSINNRYFICFGLLLLSIVSGITKKERKNGDQSKKYSLIAHPVSYENSDSIRVLVYFHMPYRSLQFIKIKSGFKAEYEATLSVLSDNGIQRDYRVWSDTILVDEYEKTISAKLFITFMADLQVLNEKIRLESNIMDLDTRNIYEQSKVIDLSQYEGELILFPPIILIDHGGKWGFKNGKIPILSYRIGETNELSIYISGRAKAEEVKIVTVINSKGEGNVWKNEDKLILDSNYFHTYKDIPDSALKGIKYSLKSFLIQKKNTISRTTHFSLKRIGISELISDIDLAVEQMSYILNDEQILSFKRTKQVNLEKLFTSYWKNIDPTPNTMHNELMEEYFRRVKYANEYFQGYQSGWKTDMGMIYVLFGVPDDVERKNNHIERNVYELWQYFSINKDFLFVDENGFGEFRLKTPFYGSPRY